MICRVPIKACFLLLCLMRVSAELMGSSRGSSSLQGSSLPSDFTNENLEAPPIIDSQDESSETIEYGRDDETPQNQITKRDLLKKEVNELVKRKFYAMRGKKNALDYIKRKFYATRGKKDDVYSKRKFHAMRGKKDEDYIAKRQFYASRGKKDYDSYLKRKFNAMRGKRNSYSMDSAYPMSWTWNQVQPTYERQFYPSGENKDIMEKLDIPRGYIAPRGI